MPTNFLTIHDIRDRLNCATSTIYRWMDLGEFPKPIKFGGMARWSEEDYQKFVRDAEQRRNDAGLRPKNVLRGRPNHSRNKPKKPM